MVGDLLGGQQRLKHSPQVVLCAMTIREFGDSQFDFAGELLRCRRTLVNNVPRFNIKPMPEFVQRNFVSEVSPQLLANV